MKHRWMAVLLALFCSSVITASLAAQAPLLMPGKHSLFQRILAIPGTDISQSPELVKGRKGVTPFTAFYVYERKQVDGKGWLQVGTDRHGTISGWIPEKQSLEWNQGLTVAFRDPTKHDRSLLFNDQKALQKLVASNDKKRYRSLYEEAVAGDISKDSPVVAIQPAGLIDIKDDFYLVPIHQYKDLFLGAEKVRMLEVSSVPLRAEEENASQQPHAAPDKGSNYSAGIVFAIDSTLSMDPYIDRTKEAVTKIYDSLEGAGVMGSVNFGLVSFRDNIKTTPSLGYLTRTYVDLQEDGSTETFLAKVNGLSAATVSSQDFIEDSYAGVKKAIESMDWRQHHARYLVLVTDAGPRGENDPLSSTGMSAAGLRQLAQDNGIAIFVLHLLTPNEKADHPTAASKYRALSEFPGIGSLYYGVETGNVQEFGRVLDALASQITMQVQSATSTTDSIAANPRPAVKANTQLAKLQEKVSKLGYALKMRYLQRHADGKIPNVFNAWLLDRDFKDPSRPTLDVRVLLTRDQLSDLHDVLRQVLNTAEDGLLSPQNFLNELHSLAATISRNPEELGATTATTAGKGNSLADLGFMREYIDDLPYTPEVMHISLEDWQSWSAKQQINFLHKLEAKINYYRALHDHTDLWVSLDGGAIDGDSVFPIALDMLP